MSGKRSGSSRCSLADGTVVIPVTGYPLTDVADAWQDATPGTRVVLTAG